MKSQKLHNLTMAIIVVAMGYEQVAFAMGAKPTWFPPLCFGVCSVAYGVLLIAAQLEDNDKVKHVADWLSHAVGFLDLATLVALVSIDFAVALFCSIAAVGIWYTVKHLRNNIAAPSLLAESSAAASLLEEANAAAASLLAEANAAAASLFEEANAAASLLEEANAAASLLAEANAAAPSLLAKANAASLLEESNAAASLLEEANAAAASLLEEANTAASLLEKVNAASSSLLAKANAAASSLLEEANAANAALVTKSNTVDKLNILLLATLGGAMVFGQIGIALGLQKTSFRPIYFGVSAVCYVFFLVIEVLEETAAYKLVAGVASCSAGLISFICFVGLFSLRFAMAIFISGLLILVRYTCCSCSCSWRNQAPPHGGLAPEDESLLGGGGDEIV